MKWITFFSRSLFHKLETITKTLIYIYIYILPEVYIEERDDI